MCKGYMAHFCKVFLFFPKSEEKKEKSGLLSYRKAVFLINFLGKFYNSKRFPAQKSKQVVIFNIMMLH